MVARTFTAILGLSLALSWACNTSESTRDANAIDAALPIDAAPEIPAECKAIATAPDKLPGVEAHHLTESFWMEQLAKQFKMNEVLLTPDDIEVLNQSIQVPREKYHAQRGMLAPVDWDQLASSVKDRLTWAKDALSAGTYIGRDERPLSRDQLAILDAAVRLPTSGESAGATAADRDGDQTRNHPPSELRIALDDIPIRCAPMDTAFYSPSMDMRIDRNACSTVRAQDAIRVLSVWPNGMRLIQSRFSFGWIAADAPLSPTVPAKLKSAYGAGMTMKVTGDDIAFQHKNADIQLSEGVLLPAADKRGKQAYVATVDGFIKTPKKYRKRLVSTRRGLTRRALFAEAWRYMGAGYGLGGTEGGRDCSRLLMDVFETFDIHLPRHSAWQARAGSFWIEVDENVAEAERLRLIDAAAQKGIVLLSFPGHIMLYLGRNEHGAPMVLHAFREYLTPCRDGFSQLTRVQNVTVSDLSLGRDTERKAFIERIDHITVIGKPPGVELRGVAEMRPVAQAAIPSRRKCRDSSRNSIYISPKKPNLTQPVHVIAAMRRDPGPARFTLIDPSGRQHTPDVVHLGGPPYGQVTTIAQPQKGRWTAVLADGDDVLACQRFYVSRKPPDASDPTDGPIWPPLNRWSSANENLFALFVERLFDYNIDEDVSWPNLHQVLQDKDRNLLHGYREPTEDDELKLQPDCADLPYTLRAYFAWKMRLPFGYRKCTRARKNRPPECDEPGQGDNLMSRLDLKGRDGTGIMRDNPSAFSLFVNTKVMRAVHSSSGRTLPEDELTDFYPVPLTRRALKPGTLFADPYGHLLVVADWIPQGMDKYGILVGVDAQPDGTVGRRRFWRGSFLFDPAIESGGAGFKAFRPREYIDEPVQVEVEMDGEVTLIPKHGYTQEMLNEDLEKTRRFTRISQQQYKGSKDDFYNRMEALINPRPLDATAVQISLIDALQESINRRVQSVANGERFITEQQDAPIDMPKGARIFLTSGPWEDFSTPSRDLRLLISIDSVVDFYKSVESGPERFGLREDEVERAVEQIKQLLDTELNKRTLAYTRSDGSQHTLSMKQVIDRSERFEMAYNPNDCIEIRWGADPGSNEMSTCDRHAPEEHRQRMQSYRTWFITRSRPPR